MIKKTATISTKHRSNIFLQTLRLFQYHELIKHLTLREIRARYKQSFLGLFWVVLNPFFQMLIIAFVFSHIIKMPTTGVPYTVFIYVGLLPWVCFANSMSSSMSSLVDGAGLLKKIYFPREVLVIATILAKVFDLSLSSLILIGMMIVSGVIPSVHALLFLPIFVIQLIFMIGLGLLLASFNLFFRDTQYLITLVLQLWFYLTPIVYSVETFPERYRWIFRINPLSVFINAYRQVLLGQNWPNWGSLGIGIVMSVSLYGVGYLIFKRLEGRFADVV